VTVPKKRQTQGEAFHLPLGPSQDEIVKESMVEEAQPVRFLIQAEIPELLAESKSELQKSLYI
jgi:hypothetical protein